VQTCLESMGEVALGANQNLSCPVPWRMEEHQIAAMHSVPNKFTPPRFRIPSASLPFQPSTFSAECECTASQGADPSTVPSPLGTRCARGAQAQMAVHLHIADVFFKFVKLSNTFNKPFSLSNILHYSYRNSNTHSLCNCAHVYFFLVFGLM